MDLRDTSSAFQREIEAASDHYALYGDARPIIEIVDAIQKEAFIEGIQHAADVLQEIIKNGKKGTEIEKRR